MQTIWQILLWSNYLSQTILPPVQDAGLCYQVVGKQSYQVSTALNLLPEQFYSPVVADAIGSSVFWMTQIFCSSLKFIHGSSKKRLQSIGFCPPNVSRAKWGILTGRTPYRDIHMFGIKGPSFETAHLRSSYSLSKLLGFSATILFSEEGSRTWAILLVSTLHPIP